MSANLPLWSPNSSLTNLGLFNKEAERITGYIFKNYDALWKWSVKNPDQFWSQWAKQSGFLFHQPPEQVMVKSNDFWETKWFPGAKYNFAENLLAKGKPGDLAIIFLREDGIIFRLTFLELRKSVTRLAAFLNSFGVAKGDRVCGLVPNSPFSTIGMLATTSLGAIWASASPDFGTKGILDRFEQIAPKVLLTVDCYLFKGKKISILDKVIEVSKALSAANLNYSATVVDSFLGGDFLLDGMVKPFRYSEIRESSEEIQYSSIGFQDPVYIMFSSGTTGLPKCIVQGGGVLLNHTKELSLHANLKSGEKIFYYTTCGWMMWNWTQSALAIGATICQFDGNPFYPDWTVLWKFVEEEKIPIFGTSAKYLAVLESEKAEPKESFPLESLRLLLSTGSPLFPSGFQYVYEKINKDVQLSSISGGTDLNGCFALGNPNLPVFSGEIQCRGLGMDVQVFNEDGKPVTGEKGELVCLTPFPSMPLSFWNDSDRKKYISAYFSSFKNVWCHGDFAELTANGGMIIYGRSDATLNPGGVRIGTSDIYSVLDAFPEIQDSVIIGQNWQEDVRIVLFVKMKAGHSLSLELINAIKAKIKVQASPRHVPSLVLDVPDIPYTVNGKKVEIAVRQMIHGEVVKNKNALANPESLDFFAGREELKS